MANLSLIEQPPIIQLSSFIHRWNFSLLDDNDFPYRSYGARVKLSFASDAVFDVDDNFVLTWSDENGVQKTETFTFATAPANDNELLAYSAGSISTYVNTWTNQLQVHPNIHPEFTIYYKRVGSNTDVYIELLTRSSLVMIDSFVITDADSDPNISFQILDYTEDNTPDGFKLNFHLFFSNDGNQFEEKLKLDLYPDEEGTILAELNLIMQSIVEEIAKGSSGVSLSSPIKSNIVFDYYIKAVEQGGSSYLNPGTKKVVASRNDQLVSISSLTNLEITLLNYSGTKTVSKSQPLLIHYFNATGVSQQIGVRVSARGVLGNITFSPSIFHDITLDNFESAILPVGYETLNLPNGIKEFSVEVINLKNSTVVFSSAQPIIFKVDENYYQEEYLFVAFNEWFLPETFRAIGFTSVQNNINRESAQSIDLSDPSALTPDRFQSFFSAENIYTFRTGYTSKEERTHIIRLLAYNDVSIVQNGIITNLDIINVTQTLKSEREELFEVQFTCRLKAQPKFFEKSLI
ncbi:MAG: hypothetical protein AAFO07_23835 [Bacteroidota bacterium]